MGFLSVVHSDRGIKKNTNQDSVLIKEASTDYGDVTERRELCSSTAQR